jgi:pyridoxal phosphate enzyme (YggS family)
MGRVENLAENIKRVRARVTAACWRARRDPAEVALVAVSKTFSAEIVLEAYRLGLCNFGENRVEEAEGKITNLKHLHSLRSQQAPVQVQVSQTPALRAGASVSNLQVGQPADSQPEIKWHLVGHLQSRKAREAVDLFDVIHSVDSVKLADKLSRLCVEAGRVMPILLECNVSGEASKYGFSLSTAAERERWRADVEAILKLSGVRVEGLMTVAPIAADPNRARPFFYVLRQLRDDLAARFPQTDWRHLSMGMTDDFEIAVEEGATLVRIGRAIFGERRQE